MSHVAPIVLLAFNRPDLTAQVVQAIRPARPDRLLVVLDGPRLGHPSDLKRCAEVRAVIDSIDWSCDVTRNQAERNLGLRTRVSTGLDWAFSVVESAIVLEDDCVPDPTFLTFATELLGYHEGDREVMAITGDNFQAGVRRSRGSHYFSKYSHVWGWATWRRAWSKYDDDLSFWPELRTSQRWRRIHPDRDERRYWENIFDAVAAREINSWAYPWQAAVWNSGGLTATPNTNLVANIGFGPDATHTTDPSQTPPHEPRALGPIDLSITLTADRIADRFVFDHHFGGGRGPLTRRVQSRLGSIGRVLRSRRSRGGR